MKNLKKLILPRLLRKFLKANGLIEAREAARTEQVFVIYIYIFNNNFLSI